METFATFIVVLFVYALVVLLAGAATFVAVWVIYIILDRRKQKQIRERWKRNYAQSDSDRPQD